MKIALFVAAGILAAVFPSGSFPPTAGAALPAGVRSFLDRNCAACHRTAKAPAGIDLTALAFNLGDTHNFGLWVRVHDAVRSGAMPPAGKEVANAEREAFLKAIAQPMLASERHRAVTEGRSVLRRLNRYEYENTLREVLSAPWLQLRDSLPEDGVLHRFNKSGQALDVSHVQMARYMETADQAIRQVLAASRQPEARKRYYARDQRRMLNRMRYSSFNRHPERATIPILGFEAQPDVLAEKAPLTVGDSDPNTRELEGFATPASTYIGNEYHFDQFAAPAGGSYRLRFNAFSLWIHTLFGPEGRKDRTPWWRPNREKTSRGRTTEPVTIYALSRGGEKRLLGSFDVTPEPAVHELEVHLLPGEQILPDAARLFRSRPGFVGSPDSSEEGTPGVAYRWMEVIGPLPGGPALEVNATAATAEGLLRKFMARAYRRPAGEQEVRKYLNIILARLEKGDPAEAMIAGYTAVLCSPGFLYLEEDPGPLSGYALASRLSYFLWNGPPDQELRALAAKGTLRRPEVLRAQADRLLDDPRSASFVNAFLDYWLDLRRVGDTTPDQTLYPDYYLDDLLTESALKETQLFFGHLVSNNLPASNVVQSGFTMLNSHLARHYGLPPVEGVAMRKVALPTESVRGGLMTQASVLKITANGTTTSPVLRGVWIMERILGNPPPPPPPGVPAVEPDTRGATTIRQQLDKHRSIASCAVCHNKIDPPGFALENFDVLGAYRERYRSTEEGEPAKGLGKNGHAFAFRHGQVVDASGQLANGEKFADVRELKRLLLNDERSIARNLVTQFVTYATGAAPGFADRVEVERILDEARRERYGVRSLIREIIQSGMFTNK
ncbi:MAG: DUF1592 domain-containing protein [Bryobacteraceae bacterium]|nr:DUF1592 domain-containing protein [Bryobacteraceae bacterium]